MVLQSFLERVSRRGSEKNEKAGNIGKLLGIAMRIKYSMLCVDVFKLHTHTHTVPMEAGVVSKSNLNAHQFAVGSFRSWCNISAVHGSQQVHSSSIEFILMRRHVNQFMCIPFWQAAYVAQPGTSNFRSLVIYKARMRIQYSFPLHNFSKHTTQPSINIWNVCLQAYWPSWDGSYSYWSSWAAATQTCGWSQWKPRSFNFESSRVWAPGWNYSSAKVITWWEPTYTP